jgi:hypothetical protein
MRFSVKLALNVLKRVDLTMQERTACTSLVLDKIEALPLSAIITEGEGGILINGKPVDIETMKVLRDSAKAALDNRAFNFIGEQVVWIAIQRGIHNADTPEKLYFYRAAIWFGEQMKSHLQILAQQSPIDVDN